MEDIPKNIAIIYDRVNKWGGAERVLLALHEIFPESPLFTAVYNPESAGWAKIFPQVIPSFLQKFPYAKSHHELYPWLAPLAFESFNFNQYDAVISVTSADAKGIVTQPKTFHLCYCLTPTRYLWSHENLYRSRLDPATRYITIPLFNYLKSWDFIASRRPDSYLTISSAVQTRISEYYSRDSRVVYPPVDTEFFAQDAPRPELSDYFLWVGRLVFHKGLELIIRVFNEINLPLVIIGTGSQEERLKNISGKNISFLGFIEDQHLVSYYRHSRAVLYFHEEDFGIVPVEAMAAGRPVIGLRKGGLEETVIHGLTGHLIDQSTPQALKDALLSFNHLAYDSKTISTHAQKFSKEHFKEEFVKVFKQEQAIYRSKS